MRVRVEPRTVRAPPPLDPAPPLCSLPVFSAAAPGARHALPAAVVGDGRRSALGVLAEESRNSVAPRDLGRRLRSGSGAQQAPRDLGVEQAVRLLDGRELRRGQVHRVAPALQVRVPRAQLGVHDLPRVLLHRRKLSLVSRLNLQRLGMRPALRQPARVKTPQRLRRFSNFFFQQHPLVGDFFHFEVFDVLYSFLRSVQRSEILF
mmetsp:Transcript_8063/g.17213  ORF Transcript_8063/g.17213 Transcript_8063/m.17213 type:complete len:205 (+) Transcript_8063:742-1356(+)